MPDRAARILYVTDLDPSQKFGSLEQNIVALAARSRARGGMLVPVFSSGPVPSALSERLEKADSPPAVSLNLKTWHWDTLRRLLALVDTHAIDIVDISFYAPLNRYVTLLRVLRPSLHLVYTDHRSHAPDEKPPGVLRRLLRNAALLQYDKIFVISHFTCVRLKRDGWPRLAPCQLFVDPARFRADPFTRARVRAEHGAGTAFVALVVAHLIPWKGVDVALRAVALASPSARLWIVGAGSEIEKLKRLAYDLGIATRVSFMGGQYDVSPFMQGADCLLCPSLWQEAMGFVNLEAMASGLPVVASRIGGIPEFVIHETTGLLVDAGDVNQMAAALRRLIDAPAYGQELGRNGAARVNAAYSEETCLEPYLKNYDHVIANTNG